MKWISGINNNKSKIRWILLSTIAFIALNTFLITQEFFYLPLLPALTAIFLLFIFSLDKVLLLIAFLTPLAVNLMDYEIQMGLSLPTEPLMAGVLLFSVVRFFYDWKIDKRILKHPVTIAILINLIWIFITSISSELPLVSFKFFIARLWFVIPFYLIGVMIFAKPSNIRNFAWLYMISLVMVVIYSTVMLISWNFSNNAAHWVMSPFFNDHTAYGAAIAMFIFPAAGFVFIKEYSRSLRYFALFLLSFLIIALILSLSRAAWVSFLASLGIFFIVKYKIRLRWLFAVIFLLLATFLTFQQDIMFQLKKNKQDSSTDLVEHARSISNISSDASNLERLNRWNAAFRLFSERPLMGWGPGTYQFVYAPYQFHNDKTIISTNAGDKGNAHSEYFGPLAESGVPGMLTVILIIICVIYTAVKVFKHSKQKHIKYLSLWFLLGLITYYIHGLLNNFLDTDKLSVPFWGFTAIIVAIDVYHSDYPNIPDNDSIKESIVE
jgi:O-antigen ligase